MKQKPNVIIFFTDQQRWDTTGVHGNPLSLTPNFDRMAQEGTHFQHFFTCQPLCTPARACLQTGLYATASGCFHNKIPLPQNEKTLAHYFGEAGYATGYIGKWHLGLTQAVPVEQRGGYDYWLAANAQETISGPYATVLYDGNNQLVKLPGYRVDALTDAAIRYIDDHKDNPFFLFLSFVEPHQQNGAGNFPAPKGYDECYAGRWSPPDLTALVGNAPQHLGGYYGMVKRLDEALGRILDSLISLNLSDDTIVYFTSDHACHFKTRNGEYKRSCHESSIRVPAAAIGPGFMNGGRIQELVSLIDLPPTILDAARITVPQQMQGRSVMPLIRRENTEWPEEVFVQISGAEVGRAIRTKRWKYSVHAPDKDPKRDSNSEEYIEQFLYDLHADPYELNNLAGMKKFEAVSQELSLRLKARMVEAGEQEPRIVPADVQK